MPLPIHPALQEITVNCVCVAVHVHSTHPPGDSFSFVGASYYSRRSFDIHISHAVVVRSTVHTVLQHFLIIVLL